MASKCVLAAGKSHAFMPFDLLFTINGVRIYQTQPVEPPITFQLETTGLQMQCIHHNNRLSIPEGGRGDSSMSIQVPHMIKE